MALPRSKQDRPRTGWAESPHLDREPSASNRTAAPFSSGCPENGQPSSCISRLASQASSPWAATQCRGCGKVAHHPDGVLWPRHHPGGSPGFPVVLLEVQMHADRGFHRRLAAETFRLLQQHEEVEHLQVLVLLANQGLAHGSSQPLLLQRFLQQDVTWVDLQALASKPDLDPLLALLTLPVQKEPDLAPCAQRILAPRPDLIALILPILSERFQGLSPQQIIATLGISKDFWRHTRAFQDILAEGRQEGLEQGRRREASALALRLLQRRCGSLEAATSARIEALSLPQLEELALALLDFQGAEDLQSWLARVEF